MESTGQRLDAALGTAAVLSCIREARGEGAALPAAARLVDARMLEHFADLRFSTGVLAQLSLDNGVLRYINAGHPPPVILRGSQVVESLDGGKRLPLGLDDPEVEVASVVLQPGDRVLCYTDGVISACDAAGRRFGEGRLLNLAGRFAAAGLPGPELVRRLSCAVADHQSGPPEDDGALLLVESSSA